MFWRYNALTSHIDTLLDKENVTLHELMDEDDILQECKGQNNKLIDFLVLPHVMEELVQLVTCEPGEDVEDKVKYKYPNIACELLTSDVPQILDKLVENNTYIDKIYNFLLCEHQLNPLLASFFTKVLGLLLVRKPDYLFEYLVAKDDFLGQLLTHLGTSAIMDLLMRLITYDPVISVKSRILKWLDDENLVEKLVNLVHVDQAEEVHSNATTTLCDIVRFGREQLGSEVPQPDPLLEKLECGAVLNTLLTNMLESSPPKESVITNGLLIFQTILEYRRQISSFDDWRPLPEGCVEPLPQCEVERMDKAIKCVLAAVKPMIGRLANLLTDPPQQVHSRMLTTVGLLDPPLGNTRLQVSKLFATLFAVDDSDLHLCLIENNVVNKLLDLFFSFIWNNFLHTQIEICISNILTKKDADGTESPRALQAEQTENLTPTMLTQEEDTPLVTHLLKDCRVISRFVTAWEENDEAVQAGSRRKGYMGHVTKICNVIVGATEKGPYAPLLSSLLEDLPDNMGEKWENLVTTKLAETNKRNTSDLVGGHPLNSSSGSDSDSDFNNIPFPQDDSMQQQAFSDYQMQQLTSNFIDQFGLSEEDFGANSLRIESPYTQKIDSLDWNINASEKEPKEYDEVCNMDGGDSGGEDEEDMWKDKEITFNTSESSRSQSTSNTNALCDSADSGSDSSDEELTSSPAIIKSRVDNAMDIDASSDISAVAPIAMDTSPWDTDTTVSGKGDDEWLPFEGADNSNGNDCGSDDWADFSNLDNSPASDGGPRVSSPDALVDGETFTSDLSKQTPAPSSQSNSDNVVSDSTQQLAPVVSIAPNSSAADGTLSIDESKQSTECAAKSSDVIVKSSDAITDSSDVILNSKDVIAESSDVMEVDEHKVTAPNAAISTDTSNQPTIEDHTKPETKELDSTDVTESGNGDNSKSVKVDVNGPTACEQALEPPSEKASEEHNPV